ncbi:hypothetical protein ALC53_06839 [Atta colombica]|uniref:Uncharacterized protein n=1 Tax=Atta colombica TaxID=520822 RepID=A0A195BEM6_9HYME|nr:hypothetical protein ALC53_06839 [Atta colombica]
MGLLRLRLRANCVKSLLLRNPCARDNPRNHLSGSEEGVSPLVSHVLEPAHGCRSPIPTTPLSWRPTITACRRLERVQHSCDISPCYGVRSARVPSRETRDRASTSTPSFLFRFLSSATGTSTRRAFFFPRGVFQTGASVFGAVKTSACIFAPPPPSLSPPLPPFGAHGRCRKSDEFRGNAFRAEHALPHLQSKVVDATVGRQARQAGGLQSSEQDRCTSLNGLFVSA